MGPLQSPILIRELKPHSSLPRPDLGEVAEHVCSFFVPLSEYVKKKWFHIEVKCLVLQKELCHETEVLTIHFMPFPVNLKERERLVSVDLVARGVTPATNVL